MRVWVPTATVVVARVVVVVYSWLCTLCEAIKSNGMSRRISQIANLPFNIRIYTTNAEALFIVSDSTILSLSTLFLAQQSNMLTQQNCTTPPPGALLRYRVVVF